MSAILCLETGVLDDQLLLLRQSTTLLLTDLAAQMKQAALQMPKLCQRVVMLQQVAMKVSHSCQLLSHIAHANARTGCW